MGERTIDASEHGRPTTPRADLYVDAGATDNETEEGERLGGDTAEVSVAAATIRVRLIEGGRCA